MLQWILYVILEIIMLCFNSIHIVFVVFEIMTNYEKLIK